jgi:hypothetical protein
MLGWWLAGMSGAVFGMVAVGGYVPPRSTAALHTALPQSFSRSFPLGRLLFFIVLVCWHSSHCETWESEKDGEHKCKHTSLRVSS